jgi:hypothetical protein
VINRTAACVSACAWLLLSGSRAFGATAYDFNDYTLDEPPEKGGKFTVRQASSLTERWDKHGVVRIAVISDHNQDHELWSGVEFINIKTKKRFNVNAVRCFVSFCVYIGKLPPGKYLINTLYADSYEPTKVTAPIRKTSAPIRNLLGSFDVKVHSLTDLGVIGIFRGVAASRDNSFETAFLGYFADLAPIYDEIYRGFQTKYFGLTGPELRWDDDDWAKGALENSLAQRRFQADFSRPATAQAGFHFPTVLGAIYSLDWERGLTRGDVGTIFMLTALSISGDRWFAGTEAGRLYVSENRGASWTAIDAFPRDEVVVHVFERDSMLHALTVSQAQASAKLYRGSASTGFTPMARTGFGLEGKAHKPAILVDFAGAKESLTQKYLNRTDLRKVRVLESGDFLTVLLNSRQIASYNFLAGSWQAYRLPQAVSSATATPDGISIVSKPRMVPASQRFGETVGAKEAPVTSILQLGPGLGAQRDSRELVAVSRGGIHVAEGGQVFAVLSLVEDAAHLEKLPQPKIYAIGGDAPPTVVRALDGMSFFHDSELRAADGGLVIIDRVAPRIHRLVESGVKTYSLYEP